MGEDYYYRISARDDCPNESALSMPALLYPCSFGGTVSIVLSPGGSTLSGIQTLTVSVTGGVTTTSATVRIADANLGTTVYSQTVSGPGPYSFPTWDTSSLSGSYVIVAAVTNSSGCAGTATLSATVAGGLGACLVPTSHSALALVTGTKNTELNYTVTNNCGFDVEITNLLMGWANRVCPTKLTNPLLEGWAYRGFAPIDLVSLLGSAVYPIGSGNTPEALFDLTNSPFGTTYLLPNLASMDLTYRFDGAMLARCKGIDTGNTFGVEYTYARVPFSGPGSTGATVIIVDPDPLSPGISLCDPIDPNCPLF
jgi:hypothetical protein